MMKCKFQAHPLLANQFQPSSLNHRINQLRLWAGKQTKLSALVVLLGLGAGSWLTTEALAPQIAQAKATRLDLSLDRQLNETFDNLARRAAASATQVAQNSFKQDNKVTEVAITVIAQNQGAIAPVLSLHVTRSQWQSDPDPSRWTTYYRSAEALLLFDNGDHTAAQAGTANPNAQPGQSTNNNPGQSGGSVNPSSSGGGVSNTSTPNQPGNSTATPGQPANNSPGQSSGGGVSNTSTPNQPGDSSSTNGRNGTPTIPGQPANNSPLSPGHAGQPATNSPYPPGQPNNSNPGQNSRNVNTPTSPRRPFYGFPNQSGNPTSTSGRNGTSNNPSPSQLNFTNPSTSGQSVNQPTTTNPSSSGQPTSQPATNNSSTPGQSGVVNSTPSPNTTPAPGSGMTPTPPTVAPVGSPSSSPGSSPADSSSPSGSSTLTPSNGQLNSTPANGQIAPSTPPTNGGTTGNTTPGS